MAAKLLSDPRVALLVSATGKMALQHVLFDRDESDSYRIRLAAMRPDRRQLTRAEVMPALPVGSGWMNAVGWESYVVAPPSKLGVENVALVGLEYVVPHADRGAFPVFAGVVLGVDDVARVLRQIATGLDPRQSLGVDATYGVVRSDAPSCDAHRVTAAWILRSASTAYADGRELLVRTAILTEDEVPGARALFSSGSLLLGSVSVLNARFPWMAREILRGLTRTM